MNAHLPSSPIVLFVVLVLATGCTSQRTTVTPESAAATSQLRSQALIDSGNAAMRSKDFDGAARRYASAAAVKPDDPAAWYGLGMALSRLGRDNEAREAYAKARALAGRPADTTSIPAH
jgi:Flp pilus assembly protein TadD